MFNALRIFAPPEFLVLSLEVQAHMPAPQPPERSQFNLLVHLFLERFSNNDMVSAEGEAKARLQEQAPAPPKAKPEATPIPPKSVRENGEPVVSPPPAVPAVTAPADAQPSAPASPSAAK